MNARRLLQMGPAEVYGRARQEISKWAERHAPGPRLGSGRRARVVTELPSRRFFPGAADPGTVTALDRLIPESRRRVLAAAESLLGNRFDLLGYRALSFGDPIDWHLDPVSGRRAPLRHWSLVDPLDGDAVGDSKVTWELNRHQWLVRLAQAYRLTGDDRFAAGCAAQITAWLDRNPRGMGINWASSLEVAFRLVSWSWVLQLLHDAPVWSSELRERVLTSLSAHASHVERYLSYYFSPNTHLTGEALGLFHAGVVFPGLPRAERWRDLGRSILEREALRQILPDGVYFEQSTCYQRYTAEIYLQFIALSEHNGLEVSGAVRERVGRLLDALLVLQTPDRSMLRIGDADGGWLLPLDLREPDDARGVFSTAAVLFGRSDYAWASEGLQAETLWLLGPAAAAAMAGLSSDPPRSAPSQVLRDGGYAVLREHWRSDADQVVLDVGPLGCPHSSGHGHADLLALQCSFRGRPYVVDPGTLGYTAAAGDRAHFRGTSAHSTIEVDGRGQAVPRGLFAWNGEPRARLLRWSTDDAALDFAEGEHRAYEDLAGSVIHRRGVILTRASGYCVVVDDLTGAGEHRVDLRFQLAPMPVAIIGDQWVRAGTPGAGGLLIRAFSTVALKVTVAEGDLEPHQGWVAPVYGVQMPAPMLVYSLVAALPVRLVTILLPTDCAIDPSSIAPIVRDGKLAGLSLDGDRARLLLDGPSLERQGP